MWRTGGRHGSSSRWQAAGAARQPVCSSSKRQQQQARSGQRQSARGARVQHDNVGNMRPCQV
jgi:hypothetical protein